MTTQQSRRHPHLLPLAGGALCLILLGLAAPGAATDLRPERDYYIFDTHLHSTPEALTPPQGDLAFEAWHTPQVAVVSTEVSARRRDLLANQADASHPAGPLGLLRGVEHRLGQTFRPTADGRLGLVRVWLQRKPDAPPDLRVKVSIVRIEPTRFEPFELLVEGSVTSINTQPTAHDVWLWPPPQVNAGEEYAILMRCEDPASLPGRPVTVFGASGNAYDRGQRIAGRAGDLWRPADIGAFTFDFATSFASWDVSKIFGMWRSLPNHCSNLAHLNRNVLAPETSNIRRTLLVSSSRARFPRDVLSPCEEDDGGYGVLHPADGSVDTREKAADDGEFIECVGLHPYKRFYATMNGFSMEVEQSLADVQYLRVLDEMLYHPITNPNGIRWAGEMLDTCNNQQMMPDGGTGPTPRVTAILDMLGERTVPISIHLPTFGVLRREFLDNGGQCAEGDDACANLIALLTAAANSNAPIHESVGHSALLKPDGWEDGTTKRFYDVLFERFPDYTIELFAVERNTVLNVPYDPANLSDLPEWFLDFMIQHSDRFTIGSHMYPKVDFTPGDKYGAGLSLWTAYWDEFFSQLAARPGGRQAVQNISHCNVERLLDVSPIPGFACPPTD